MGISSRSLAVALTLSYGLAGQIEQEAFETFSDEQSANLVQDQEQWNQWLQGPLNLNTASFEELVDLPGSSSVRAHQLIEYRRRVGAIKTIYELATLPNWDVPFIEAVAPYVRCAPRYGSKKLTGGYWKNELIIRSKSVIEKPKGAIEGEYLGKSASMYLRYTGQKGKQISWGLALEKDAWEPLLIEGKARFHRSGYLQIKPQWKLLDEVIIGSFRLSMGQGIIQKDGFRPSVGPQIRNSGMVRIRGHASSSESGFQNGLIVRGTLKPIQYGFWLSKTARSIRFDTLTHQLVTYYSDGLVRTNQRNSFYNSSFERRSGAYLLFATKPILLSFTAEKRAWTWKYQSGNHPLVSQNNASFYAMYRSAYGYLRTEISKSNDRKALEVEMLVVPDDQWKLRWVYREIFSDLENQLPNFSQGITRHSGMSSTIECFWNPLPKQHIYLRLANEVLRRDGEPGSEQEIRKRWSGRYTFESREGYQLQADLQHDLIQKRAQFRIQFRRGTPHLQITLRGQWNVSRAGQGALAFLDIQKEIGSCFRLYSRIQLYNTLDFDHRLYVYENDVLYAFSVPAFYGIGHRIYFMIRYKTGVHTIWIKAAQTNQWDANTIGSGLEERIGPFRSEITIQYKMRL